MPQHPGMATEVEVEVEVEAVVAVDTEDQQGLIVCATILANVATRKQTVGSYRPMPLKDQVTGIGPLTMK